MNNKSIRALMLVSFLWGGGFIATEFALHDLDTSLILFLRFTLASLLLLIVSFSKIKENFKNSLKPGIVVGIFLSLGFLLQTIGQNYSSPSSTAFLTSVNVIIVPILYSIDNKKILSKKIIISVLFTLIGIGLLTVNENFTIKFGDVLSLLCSLGFALHIYFSSKYSKKHELEVTSFMFIQLFVCSILFALFAFITKPEFSFNITSLSSILYLAFVSTLLCYFLQLKYQRYVPEYQTSLILSLEAVFATILSYIIFKENFEIQKIIGILIIFFTLIYSDSGISLKKTQKNKQI